jgi:predicted O-linked N-acetylglucosamine transferase (SPINDLY family)
MAMSPDDVIKRAEALAQRGETQQARQLYQALLEKNPADVRAKDGLAALDRRSAQFQALTELYQKGELAAVLERGKSLARQYPDVAFLENMLGNANMGLGRLNAAIESYVRALRLRPDIAETHGNLGKVLSQMGRQQEAISCFRNAVRIKPGYADAHYSLGVAFAMAGHNEEAIAAYQKAIGIRPDFAEAFDNLGIALREMERFDEAIACFKQELQLRPGNAATHVQLGIALRKAGRIPESNTTFAAALALQPTLADTHGQKLFQTAMICDWGALAAEAEAIAALGLDGPAVRPFVMLPLEDAPQRHRIRAERFVKERFAIPELGPFAPPSASPTRIRIGYFSANFHNHAVMYLMAKLFELHDRSRFEVHAYSYGPAADDEMRRRAQQAVEVFHDVCALNGKEIAERARKDGIDIAIDLMGHTENARSEIFAHRAAPIQINYLGYPGSWGATFMDYIVADRTLVPEGYEDHYSEKIIYLPHSYMPSDDRREISGRLATRKDMGLPEQGVVFCCFNNIYKIGANEFGIWMRLLESVPGSVLWLSGTNDWAEANLKKEAEKRKLNPNRIIFTERMSMAEHLARHRLADLFLDTFHYNAHSTASDALWAGLPVITLAGQGFAARVAASLLNAVGLSELITHSAESYKRLALELARDPKKLSALKARLAGLKNGTPLFDTERFTRNLEDAYAQAYQRYFKGEGPADIIVSGYR